MSYAVQQHGVLRNPRSESPDEAVQARMTNHLGDLADKVSLAIHREINGREWTKYQDAVEEARRLLDLVVEAHEPSGRMPVNFTGVRALKFISHYGAPDLPESEELGDESVPTEFIATMVQHIRTQLQDLLDGSSQKDDLKNLRQFFNALADSTLSIGPNARER